MKSEQQILQMIRTAQHVIESDPNLCVPNLSPKHAVILATQAGILVALRWVLNIHSPMDFHPTAPNTNAPLTHPHEYN